MGFSFGKKTAKKNAMQAFFSGKKSNREKTVRRSLSLTRENDAGVSFGKKSDREKTILRSPRNVPFDSAQDTLRDAALRILCLIDSFLYLPDSLRRPADPSRQNLRFFLRRSASRLEGAGK